MNKPGKALIAVIVIIALSLFLLPGTAVAQDGVGLRINFSTYENKVKPGEENTLYLEVYNYGDTSVSNIRLSAEVPEDWEIEFIPDTIDYLDAESYQNIDVRIIPDRYVTERSRQILIIAETDRGKTSSTVYLRIDTATSVWTWVGAGIGCLVIAGFVFVFRRFGK